mgnify:CR=1 FL=1
MTEAKYKVGDWLRWWQGSSLVIGEVRYISGDRWPRSYVYTTDRGNVDENEILECRSPNVDEL